MNRLIQGIVDVEGFKVWYSELTRNEQSYLAWYLINVFMCEKHYSGAVKVVHEALKNCGRTLEDPLVKYLFDHVGGFDSEKGFLDFVDAMSLKMSMAEWMDSLSDPDRHAVFEIGIWLFGIHEGTCLKACAGKCDHWWHQDLKNPAVARKLLSNRKRP